MKKLTKPKIRPKNKPQVKSKTSHAADPVQLPDDLCLCPRITTAKECICAASSPALTAETSRSAQSAADSRLSDRSAFWKVGGYC